MSNNTLNSSIPLLSTGGNMNHDSGVSLSNDTEQVNSNLFNNELPGSITSPTKNGSNTEEKSNENHSKISFSNSLPRDIPIGGTCYLKLLISNLVAGSIIGPKGSTVLHISSTTNCSVKLSNSTCLYPGTNERVVIVSGKLENLQKAFLMILERIRDSQISSNDTQSNMEESNFSQEDRMVTNQNRGMPRIAVKIVVPNSAVSQIIGKEGASVKELQAKTNTRVQISNRDERQLKERIVNIMGTIDNVAKASFHIIESIQSDPHIKHHIKLNYTLADNNAPIQSNALNCFLSGMPLFAGGNLNPLVPDVCSMLSGQMGSGAAGAFRDRSLALSPKPLATTAFYPQNFPSNTNFIPMPNKNQGTFSSNFDLSDPKLWNPASSGPILEYTFAIPNSCVGYLIGRNGITLQHIQQQAGVKIRISKKGEFVRGTENRRLTISGNALRIQCAAVLLQHRLQLLEGTGRSRDTTQDNTFGSNPNMLNSTRKGSSEQTFTQSNSVSMMKGASLTPVIF